MSFSHRCHATALRTFSLLIFGIVLLCSMTSITHAQDSITPDSTIGTQVQVDGADYVIGQGAIESAG